MERKCNTNMLNQIIKERGIQKTHIAREMNIAPPRLSEKLTGRVFLYPDELVQILRIVGFDDVELWNERLADWYTEGVR